MVETFELGDVVQMKKPHPCGSNIWTIIRTGMDVKIKCAGCGRVVMLERGTFMKRARRIVRTQSGEKE
ncbi:MAG: DUF951 domain-containing protein [Christensenellales bacterium]|jgi:hypothetical protein